MDAKEYIAEVYTHDKQLRATLILGEGRHRLYADEYDSPSENAEALKSLQDRLVQAEQEKEGIKQQMEQEKEDIKQQMEQEMKQQIERDMKRQMEQQMKRQVEQVREDMKRQMDQMLEEMKRQTRP